MSNFIENFTIPFYQFQVKNWEDKQKRLLELFYSIENNLTNNDPNSNVYTDFFKENNYIKNVGDILREEFVEFVKRSKIGSCRVIESWFQKYTNGCFHSPHNHGAIGYSSVCFIKFDKDEHQPTRFLCPFNSPEGYMMEYVPENVSEGTIIFFPSMLMHYVLPTNSDKDRIILSFNVKS